MELVLGPAAVGGNEAGEGSGGGGWYQFACATGAESSFARSASNSASVKIPRSSSTFSSSNRFDERVGGGAGCAIGQGSSVLSACAGTGASTGAHAGGGGAAAWFIRSGAGGGGGGGGIAATCALGFIARKAPTASSKATPAPAPNSTGLEIPNRCTVAVSA